MSATEATTHSQSASATVTSHAGAETPHKHKKHKKHKKDKKKSDKKSTDMDTDKPVTTPAKSSKKSTPKGRKKSTPKSSKNASVTPEAKVAPSTPSASVPASASASASASSPVTSSTKKPKKNKTKSAASTPVVATDSQAKTNSSSSKKKKTATPKNKAAVKADSKKKTKSATTTPVGATNSKSQAKTNSSSSKKKKAATPQNKVAVTVDDKKKANSTSNASASVSATAASSSSTTKRKRKTKSATSTPVATTDSQAKTNHSSSKKKKPAGKKNTKSKASDSKHNAVSMSTEPESEPNSHVEADVLGQHFSIELPSSPLASPVQAPAPAPPAPAPAPAPPVIAIAMQTEPAEVGSKQKVTSARGQKRKLADKPAKSPTSKKNNTVSKPAKSPASNKQKSVKSPANKPNGKQTNAKKNNAAQPPAQKRRRRSTNASAGVSTSSSSSASASSDSKTAGAPAVNRAFSSSPIVLEPWMEAHVQTHMHALVNAEAERKKQLKASAAAEGLAKLQNNYLAELHVDTLYHLGLNSSMDLKKMFGDTKFVCMGGSPDRMREFAKFACEELNLSHLIPTGCSLAPIGKSERYHMYKIGPVISVSHGMGMPSLNILLHEITKLLMYAGATDFCYIRVGTSGGIGVKPGTVIVTDKAFNATLQPKYELVQLGKRRSFNTVLDTKLAHDIVAYSGHITTVIGSTMGADDFYEEQARVDGYFCDYTRDDQVKFMARLHKAGVRNIEMESTAFAAFTSRAGIPGAVVCTTLVDRLAKDQIGASSAQLQQYVSNATQVVISYMRATLNVMKSVSENGQALSAKKSRRRRKSQSGNQKPQ
jgi:uridine phosphorylase